MDQSPQIIEHKFYEKKYKTETKKPTTKVLAREGRNMWLKLNR